MRQCLARRSMTEARQGAACPAAEGRARTGRPGGGQALDYAGLCRRQARTAAIRAARLCGTPQGWLELHAGRLCPGRLHARYRCDRHAAGRTGRRCLDHLERIRSRKDTLLPREDDTFRRNVPGTLPSRAAENLMWMGRYIERAEGTARILRACHARYAEAANMELPLLAEMRDYLKPLGVDLDTAIPKGLQRSIDGADAQRRPHPRPLFARWLAGVARPVERPSTVFTTVSARRRRDARHDDHPAQARRVLRPRARKHVSLYRLAFPRNRPPARARHPDGAHPGDAVAR